MNFVMGTGVSSRTFKVTIDCCSGQPTGMLLVDKCYVLMNDKHSKKTTKTPLEKY